MADKYPGWTPYNYTLNNPVRLVDPTGMSADTIKDGRRLWELTSREQDIVFRDPTETDWEYWQRKGEYKDLVGSDEMNLTFGEILYSLGHYAGLTLATSGGSGSLSSAERSSKGILETIKGWFGSEEDFGVNLGGKKVPVYRGGSDFTLKPGEFRVTPNGKYPARGLSLNADASKVANYGGAKQIKSIPDGLKIIHTPSKANPMHFDIIPTNPKISHTDFQKLLYRHFDEI